MGQECICMVRHEGKYAKAKVLLETSELIVRGELSLKISFSSITALSAADGELRVRTKDGLTILELGVEKAAKWRERIANPKSLIEKLGQKAGDEVVLIGKFEQRFLRDLKKAGAKLLENVSSTTKWILLNVEAQADLAKVKASAKSMSGATALWIVYPKGQKALTEHDVRGAGLKAGLTDVKVTRFSESHTALKFVIPKAGR